MADRGYVLCTTPRSGSNYLCQLLASTGVLGRPLEYFNGAARRRLGWDGYPDDPQAQLALVLSEGATANGCYGLKIFPSQADKAQAVDWARALPGLAFVHLRRRDLLGQAMSWARGELTGRYRASTPGRSEPVYDPDRIQARLADIVREEARWSLFFARTGREPLRLVYEEVMADPQAAADAVAAAVGVAPARCDPSAVDLVIQRDALSEVWRARFVAERGALVVDRI
jgi:LPS sulfotransferase NodH